MTRWVYLSYIFNNETPAYGNGDTIKINALKSITKGDTCNTFHLDLPDHLGTHLDVPRHFFENGKSFEDYPACFWHFKEISFIQISDIASGQNIGPEDMKLLIEDKCLKKSAELLLLKTGFGSYRGRADYWKNGPVFSPDLAIFLRETYPNLRVFGVDTISISSWKNREIGRQAHRAFLGLDKPILLLEDMNLLEIGMEVVFLQVIVSPLRLQGGGGSPCTVLAEVQ